MKRKKLQGLWNIIRFNRHFYIAALILLVIASIGLLIVSGKPQVILLIIVCLTIIPLAVSLLASYYIYDLSDLYEMSWLPDSVDGKVLNLHSGFDETSQTISRKYPGAELFICDFYNPKKHTEISIERARKAYPANPKTITINTDHVPFNNGAFGVIVVCLSAHEIRDKNERIQFFHELHRVIKPTSNVYVTEHLRDFNNFIAYTLGFFHFHSRRSWLETFSKSGFKVSREKKTTPFVTTFILTRDGNSL